MQPRGLLRRDDKDLLKHFDQRIGEVIREAPKRETASGQNETPKVFFRNDCVKSIHVYHQGMPAIKSSFNVASISDDAAGLYEGTSPIA